MQESDRIAPDSMDRWFRDDDAWKAEAELDRRLIDTANAVLVVLDESGRVVRVNQATERLLGLAADEIVGEDWFSRFVYAEDVAAVKAAFNRALCSGSVPTEFENAVRAATGKRRIVAWRNSFVPSARGDGSVALALGIDVTEQRLAESWLADSEERFRALFHHSPEGQIVVDPNTTHVIDANEEAARILGYTPEALRNLRLADLDAVDDGPAIGQQIDRVLRQGSGRFETRQRRRSGEVIDVDVAARVVHGRDGDLIYTSLRDITGAKANRAKLAEQEHHIRLLLESTAEGIVGVDFDGLCTFANTAALRLLGCDRPEDLLGASFHDEVHADSGHGETACADGDCPILRAITNRQDFRSDTVVFRRRDGSRFPVELNCRPIPRDSGCWESVITFVDISERKEAQAAQQKLVALVSASAECVFLVNENNQIEYTNAAAADLTAHVCDDPATFEAEWLWTFVEKVRTAGQWIGEAQVADRTGHRLDMLVDAFPIERAAGAEKGAIAVVCRDITDLRTAERGRAASEVRLAAAIEAIDEGFALWDKDGRLVVSNAQFEALPEPVKQRAFQLEGGTQQIALGSDTWRLVDVRHDLPGGESVAVLTDISLLKSRQHALEAATRKIERQAEDLSRFAEDLRVALRAEEAARLDAERSSQAKSVFLATMSHELRTPLNAILGFSEVIETDVFKGDLETYRGYAANINLSGRHLLSIIDDILDISQIDAGKASLKRQPVRLIETLGQCLSMFEHAAQKKRLTLGRANLPDVIICGDPTALLRVFNNLVSNAIKFTPEGGGIDVSGVVDAEVVEIRITDTGIGIPYERLATIMEPFERVEQGYTSAAGGVGLGLSLARMLTRLHGGDLRLSSGAGAGVTARVVLPLWDDTAGTPSGTIRPDPMI